MNTINATQITKQALKSHTYLESLGMSDKQLQMLCAEFCPHLYPKLVEQLKCHDILSEFSNDVQTFDRFKTNTILALEFYPPQAREIIMLDIANLIGDDNPEDVTPQHIYQQGLLLGFSLPKHIVR